MAEPTTDRERQAADDANEASRNSAAATDGVTAGVVDMEGRGELPGDADEAVDDDNGVTERAHRDAGGS
jgi:hypothetical protein